MRLFNYLRRNGYRFKGVDEFKPEDGRSREEIYGREDHDRDFKEDMIGLLKK